MTKTELEARAIEQIAKDAAKAEGFSWGPEMDHIHMQRDTFHRVIGHAIAAYKRLMGAVGGTDGSEEVVQVVDIELGVLTATRTRG